MADIILTAAIATVIVLLLALLVLAARYWLVPDGTASITINERRRIDAPLGERLLWALASQDIMLPAACGGRGACGQCRVTITDGAESPLPSESAHISRRDTAAGVRLACVTTMRHDLSIRLPDSALDAQRITCSVRSNNNVTTYLKELVLTLPDDSTFDFRAGDYVTLDAPAGRTAFADFDIDSAYRHEWQRQDLFSLSAQRDQRETRAYSIANAPDEANTIRLIVRIATPPPSARKGTPPGQVSSYVFGLKAGDQLTLSGPFGEFHAPDTDAEMILIGGGAGIAPLRAIVRDQLIRKHSKRAISLWYGVRNTNEICLRDEFDALAAQFDNFSWHVALSDPDIPDSWHGPKGLIHSVVYAQYLSRHQTPEDAAYLICGPPLMSRAVIAMLEDLGVDDSSIFIDDFGG